jgi:hypothetical protein
MELIYRPRMVFDSARRAQDKAPTAAKRAVQFAQIRGFFKRLLSTELEQADHLANTENLGTIHEMTRTCTKRESEFESFRVLSWIVLFSQ